MSDSVVIVGAKRTAIGSMLGQFTGVPTPTLGATAIRAALQQSGVPAGEVSEVIKAGSATVVVAGGMESMTNAPHMVAARAGLRYGEAKLVDHMAWDGLTNPYDGKSMGVFAEATATKYGFTREQQDAFAIESVKRSQAAIASGAFAD